MRKRLVVAVYLLISAIGIHAQNKHPITFDDLIRLARISDVSVSPDGKRVAFVLSRHDAEKNSIVSEIYTVPISGGVEERITSSNASTVSPRWMPDGKTIAFLSARDGESQIYKLSLDGGEAQKITSFPGGVNEFHVSPDGSLFAFAAETFPDCSDEASLKRKLDSLETMPSKVKIFTELLYRHWNAFREGRRTHYFTMPATGGDAVDRTPGAYDTPPISLGGSRDFVFSPDMKKYALARNPDAMVAASTNNDVFLGSFSGSDLENLTAANRAVDNQPMFSPDGMSLSYKSMSRPGFEADRQTLMIRNLVTGEVKSLTANLDRSIDETIWSPDGKSIYFTTEHYAHLAIFKVDVMNGRIDTLLDNGYNRNLTVTSDGATLVFIRERMNEPAELWSMRQDGKQLRRLTKINDAIVSKLEMNPGEEFYYAGAGGDRIHSWLLKPPGFDPNKKYPVIVLVHGGPQGQWGDQFHYRWNAQMFASRGYVVLMPNVRGSTGFGQKLTDEISRDWGGKAYEDIMLGLDQALRTYAFLDVANVAAAGASYGGYMINWIAGNTDRFKCLVTHSGVFNPSSMYGSTEELWFPEWEFGGTYYDNPELFRKWSPLEKAKYFKTPTLVIHGQRDFRVDVSEGFQMFTALQRQGVPSKMLYFPDEGHWVAKPANAKVWYTTVLDWIDRYTK